MMTDTVDKAEAWDAACKIPPAIEAALRSAFPHFQNDEPITPEMIARIGAEWNDMVVNWAPFQHALTFSDQDGKTREIEWLEGEPEAGCFSGYVIPEDANWQVTATLTK